MIWYTIYKNKKSIHNNYVHTYIHTYIHTLWVQVTHDVILSNVTLPDNLLLNSYFENPTVGLHVLYVLNIRANFHINRILFTIWFIN